MDIIEYLRPSTINDATLYRAVAIVLQPMQNEVTHHVVIAPNTTTPSASSSSSSVRRPPLQTGAVSVDALDASTHMTPPTATSAALLASPFASSLDSGAGFFSSLWSMGAAAARIVPRTAAAVQCVAARTVPLLWKLTPPVVLPSPLSVEYSNMNNMNKNNNSGGRNGVALHPHRRLIAVATPREGSSKHGAVLIYDLQQLQQQQQHQQPKQVLRNVLLRDMVGISWKPGSKNVLCVYGQLGVSLFHLSVDPVTGRDVEDDDEENDGGENGAGQQNPFVHPSTGVAAASRNRNLGVGCLYPVVEQLSRFGIAPVVDRIAFFPDNGRLIACGSSESAGIRIVDTAFSPMQQLYSEWSDVMNISGGNSNYQQHQQQQQQRPIAGTFCGSPAGATCDLTWIPQKQSGGNNSSSPTLLLLRTIFDTNKIEVFAVGVTHPVASLSTELPVVQIVVSPWPNIEEQMAPKPAAGGAVDHPILRNIARNGHHGVIGKLATSLDVKPDRHVPVWLLYDRCEGAVLSCLSFNAEKLHHADAPMFVTNLLRVSTTAPGLAPSTHPGGRVTRIAAVKETSAGSKDSGSLLMSVESGHVIAVKVSRNSNHAQGGGPGVYAAQTTMIVPVDEDLASSDMPAELVGVFGTGSGSKGSVAAAPAADCFTFVTWNAQDATARIVTSSSGKSEVA